MRSFFYIIIGMVFTTNVYAQINIVDTIYFDGIARMNLKTGEIKLSIDTNNYNYNCRKINNSFKKDTMWVIEPRYLISLFKENNVYIDSILDSKLSNALLSYNYLMGIPITKDSSYYKCDINSYFLKISIHKDLLRPYNEYKNLTAFYEKKDYVIIFCFY